jgi:hypothetical protein
LFNRLLRSQYERGRAPLGLSFSFLLASPIVNEIAAFLLLGLCGIEITAIYLVSALVAAIIGGVVIGTFDLDHLVNVRITTNDRTVATRGAHASCSCESSVQTTKTHREHVETAAGGA